MLCPEIINLLEIQMHYEKKASFVYKKFEAISDYLGLEGCKSYFNKKSKEEDEHFDKIFKYLCDQNIIPKLLEIPEQSSEILTIQEIFKQALDLEAETTESLKLISDFCKKNNDDQTYYFILDFLKEQIEEEKEADTLCKMLAFSEYNILVFDREIRNF